MSGFAGLQCYLTCLAELRDLLPHVLQPSTLFVNIERVLSLLANLRRGVKGLRLGRLPGEERDGIDAEVLAAYDRSVASLATLGAEIVDLTLPARFADLGAINGRIMSAEAYAALASLVDDNAQPLDQDVRPRVRAGAAISSKDYLRALAERERLKVLLNAAIEGVDALLTPTAVHARHASRPRSIRVRRRQCSRAGSISWTFVQRQCRTGLPLPDCQPPCRSSAGPMLNPWCCGSVMLTKPRMTGTSGFRPWRNNLRACL